MGESSLLLLTGFSLSLCLKHLAKGKVSYRVHPHYDLCHTLWPSFSEGGGRGWSFFVITRFQKWSKKKNKQTLSPSLSTQDRQTSESKLSVILPSLGNPWSLISTLQVEESTLSRMRVFPRKRVSFISQASNLLTRTRPLLRMKVKVKLLSGVRLFATPWTVAYQASSSMGFSSQEYQSGLLFPSPGDLPNTGIEPRSPALQAEALPSEPPGKPLVRRRFLKILLKDTTKSADP